MICDICKKTNAIHFRVTNSKTLNWIFTCTNCWLDFAKTEGYKYGGTRKVKMRKKAKNQMLVKEITRTPSDSLINSTRNS